MGNLQVSRAADHGEVGREEKGGVLDHECFIKVGEGARDGVFTHCHHPSHIGAYCFPELRRQRVDIERFRDRGLQRGDTR